MARRDNADRPIRLVAGWRGRGRQPRVLYNRASCDLDGKPYNPKHKLISWNGAKWPASVPDIRDDRAGGRTVYHEPEGVAVCSPRMMATAVPEHYERSRLGRQRAASKVGPNPWRGCSRRYEVFGKPDDFDRRHHLSLTEHFHFWSKHVLINAFCSRAVRRDRRGVGQGKGVANGDSVEVRRTVARSRPWPWSQADQAADDRRQIVHTVGIPIHGVHRRDLDRFTPAERRRRASSANIEDCICMTPSSVTTAAF